ncbi:MAG TPA: hypothetical protein DCS04_00315 [Ruminococcaceae bacterium]|nr:hypothetical protein [Oscillospiraceae bacterium]
MKPEKKSVVIISAILVIAVTATLVLIPLISRNSGNRYMREDLRNVDNVTLISHCIEINGVKNSVAGFKECVRLGAKGVIVDLCFKKDGTPVISDSYSTADSAETVEDLFKAMSDGKYKEISVYFNIIQLSDLSRLNSLAVSYNILDRVFLIGIDSEHYDLINTDDTIIPFLLDYNFKDSDLDALKKGSFTRPDILDKYGATGLVLPSSQISEELVEALNDYGILYIVNVADESSDMCQTLLKGADNVIVPDIEKASRTMNEWTLEMQKRYKESVDKSIKALSEKENGNK